MSIFVSADQQKFVILPEEVWLDVNDMVATDIEKRHHLLGRAGGQITEDQARRCGLAIHTTQQGIPTGVTLPAKPAEPEKVVPFIRTDGFASENS